MYSEGLPGPGTVRLQHVQHCYALSALQANVTLEGSSLGRGCFMSEHFQAAQRSDTVNDERPDGEEGETQPEAQGAPDTREEVHRLHHVVLLHYTVHTLTSL